MFLSCQCTVFFECVDRLLSVPRLCWFCLVFLGGGSCGEFIFSGSCSSISSVVRSTRFLFRMAFDVCLCFRVMWSGEAIDSGEWLPFEFF